MKAGQFYFGRFFAPSHRDVVREMSWKPHPRESVAEPREAQRAMDKEAGR